MWQDMKDWIKEALSNRWQGLKDWLAAVSGETWKKVALIGVALAVIYYPLGMIWSHKIDDDTTAPMAMVTANAKAGGSRAVDMVSYLIEREVDNHGWVMNDPFLKASSLLDNMPNYQQGMMNAFSRFSIELRDQIGRTRGSSAADSDLETAAGLLPYPGDVWIFNFSTSWLPTASAEQQYRKAKTALDIYNARLAEGVAVYERRADNLEATLDRIAKDVGASTAAVENHIRERSHDWIDFEAADLFYNIKGQAYGYYMILLGLRQDYQSVIAGKELSQAYEQMLESFKQVAVLDPLMVTNGAPDNMIFANHLAVQGFYLMRARTQLQEVGNILLK